MDGNENMPGLEDLKLLKKKKKLAGWQEKIEFAAKKHR